jgi:D-glutamate cyclase
MRESCIDQLCEIIQDDVNGRGLRAVPENNLLTAARGGLHAAALDLARSAQPALAIVTGFYIPTATPPCGETDGPLGALFLARALVPLGVPIALCTDDFCAPALRAGLAACAVPNVPVVVLPTPAEAKTMTAVEYARNVRDKIALGPLTHLLALERVGPSHTLAAIPPEHRDRCHTMRGGDVSELMSPVHYLFEEAHGLRTIGIGDGGNEIGMGKIAWDVIRANIPRGDLIACRVPTDDLIVCGISNWGAYALAAAVALLREQRLDARLFDGSLERRLLQTMVDAGPLVDGVAGRPVATVDGLAWERYAEVLERIGALVMGER